MKPTDKETTYEVEWAIRNPRDGKLGWKTFGYAPSLEAASQAAFKNFNSDSKWRIREVVTVSVSKSYRDHVNKEKDKAND